MPENNIVLKAEGICKQFNGVQVLKSVDLEVSKGEIHALMGENGAGKSTIIKIITGVYAKDAGQIYFDGRPVEINSRQDARACGISVIYQELSLVPAMTVTENVFLGQEIMKHGLPDKKTMRKRVQELIEYYDFAIDPDAIVGSLGMAKRQMTEILKALSMDAKLLIMDEPTCALTAGETEKLFVTMDNLRKRGTSILYISHRLEEVYRMADRLTVMRDGENVGVLGRGEITPKRVTEMMIGHEIREENAHSKRRLEDFYLEVRDLSFMNLLKDISFKAYGGEILGIGGLVGSGRTELISCIYGSAKPSGGTITLGGKPVSRSVRRNIRCGFGLVPEDRKSEGFFPVLSIERNINSASFDLISKLSFISRRREIDRAEKAIKDYDIRPPMRSLPVANLSGGNQQKVILGRWLSRDLKVLLLDEPTAGVDVGVKAELYRLMREMADAGGIIIMVTSDIEELVNVSDRVIIMREGRLFEEFGPGKATQSAVVLASSGVHTEEGAAL